MAVRMDISAGQRGSRKRKSVGGKTGRSRSTKKRARYNPYEGGRGVEMKFHDLDIDDALVAQGGTIAQVSCLTIAQGTGESERLGRKCLVKKIGWRFTLSMPSQTATGNTSDEVRVILYLDKQANGASATVSAAVDGNGILATSDFQSFNNLANKGRFLTLMDRTYNLYCPSGGGDGTTVDFGEQSIADTFYKNCSIPVEYDSSLTTGVIATMRTNNIGVLLLSKSGFVNFASKMRVRFMDG